MGDFADEAIDRMWEDIGEFGDCDYSDFSSYRRIRSRKQYGPGKCPRCGGETRLVNGKNGPFYGCTRFPNCRGSREVVGEVKKENYMPTNTTSRLCPKFYVLIAGKGAGCDYTIGCNMKFRELKARDWEEARDEANKIADDDRIESVKLLLVNSEEDVDMESLEASRESEKSFKEKEKRRMEYERLKREFGKG
jgi:ssDNA-binding Zn-finger/Zn-ribbon topoisomerase 1